MSNVESATAELLADRPEIESDLRTLLDVDADGSWTFDDVPLDSGTFGEIVSTGIIKSVDDAYRVRDPEAVRAVLNGRTTDAADKSSVSLSIDIAGIRGRLGSLDPVALGTLVVLLLFVVVMRTAFSWSAVFRGENVVLLGNDPYFYRFWLDELTRTPATLGSLPAAVRSHDVFMIATLWVGTLLLGGTQQAVSSVLTWYPVLAAVATGGLLYWIATASFADRRIGFAALGIYATTPILAYRSALGFGDHHAFDYLLVTIAIAGLIALVTESSHWRVVARRRITGVIGVILGVAGQVHAWRGGSLLVAPLAAYIVISTLINRRKNRDPFTANAWFLGALGTAALISLAVHIALGWSPLFRAATPLLLFGWSAVVVGIGVAAHRLDLSASTMFITEVVSGIVATGIVWLTVPTVRDAMMRGVAYFSGTGSTGISETASLFSPNIGVVTTPFYYLGATFIFGLVGLVYVSYRLAAVDRSTWTVLCAYGWTLLVAGTVQLRFASQFGLLCAVFAGFVFVYVLGIVDLIDPLGVVNSLDPTTPDSTVNRTISLPEPRVLGIIVVVFLLVSGFGLFQTFTGTDDIKVSDEAYKTSIAINDYATDTGTTWPDNYVLSRWSWNRAYNYYVNGKSESYTYARNNYRDFLTATDPTPWYERLSEKPVGYVVVEPAFGPPPDSMQARLWSNWGSATNTTAGLGHYRAIHATADRKVYEVVPGAELSWDGIPGETRVIQTTVTVGNETVTYERRVTAGDDGQYSVRVPYAGSYEIGSEGVTVSEAAVRSGNSVSLSDSG
ncbi:hypothetical protein DM826_03050 [Halonotius aquaticus]|uniref:Archaeal glycosylation protein B peripheral domain-containing protein n=1 Tax=Halonotius aquaticus TaxID=2216978 RepID=A0A3A6PRW9_9EURY|nr:hypothetical protein [Halonotius aquaticus]RJX44606.1 hypothetical protein DM826_03050 [Halonotius aquaticus]